MSRLAKKPIVLPGGVNLTVTDSEYLITGPKGELKRPRVPKVKVEIKKDEVILSVPNLLQTDDRTYIGTAARLLRGMIEGVTKGFEKKLEINGVGFRAEIKGKDLFLYVGHSHPVQFPAVAGVNWQVEKNVITVSGIDKELVGQVAANIRKVRKPEPYKGKGIKYQDEEIRRKEGKQVKSES